MELKDRIALIIEENGLRQVELAGLIGVSGSYISTLLSGRNRNVSPAVAGLIEEKLGYSSAWVLSGEGAKLSGARRNPELSDSQSRAIFLLERMSSEKAEAVLAFIDSLDRVGAALQTGGGSGGLFAAFSGGNMDEDESAMLKRRIERKKGRL